MRSDQAKKGPARAPHRSLLKAAGYDNWEIDRPWIGVVNAYNSIIPGHVHLKRLVEGAKAGVYAEKARRPRTTFSPQRSSSVRHLPASAARP